MPTKKTHDELSTLLEHWQDLVTIAAQDGVDLQSREHANCFIAGAYATLRLLGRAAESATPRTYVQTFKALHAEVDGYFELARLHAEGSCPFDEPEIKH